MTSVTFTLTNPALSASPPAILYDGVSADLSIVLTNGTDGDVPLAANTTAFTLYPQRCFTTAQLQAATLTVPAGLTAALGDDCYVVTVGAQDYDWAAGTTLDCTLSGIESTGPDGTYVVEITFTASALPRAVTATLAVQQQPVANNPDLSSVLSLSLQPGDANEVYVSTIAPFLYNTLTLNIENQTDGPIYTGSDPGTPTVMLSFVYGADDGSLTPMNTATQINVLPSNTDGNDWGVTQSESGLVWTLTPPPADPIGYGSSGNVTIGISDIVALTAAGPVTQMTLQFGGFQQTDTVPYNPWVVQLSLDKLVAPSDRGVADFASKTVGATATSPTDELSIAFGWTMNFVASITINYTLDGTPGTPFSRSYGEQTMGATDCATVSFTGIVQDTTVWFTLDGFDENGTLINSQQYAVDVLACFFQDPRDQQLYGAMQVGTQMWMTHNLAYASPNSELVDNSSANTANFGLFYPNGDANSVPQTAEAWRLPTQADFDTLISSQLTPTQSSSMQPGGGWALGTTTQLIGDTFFWTATADTTASIPSAFIVYLSLPPNGASKFISRPTGPDPNNSNEYWFASVRYVRDVSAATASTDAGSTSSRGQ